LALGGLVAGVLVCEIGLWIADVPRFYKPHSFPAQFAFLTSTDNGVPIHVNVPNQRIRFVYDGNPRGYFGPDNEVDHDTNSLGYRGPEFPIRFKPEGAETDKAEKAFRIVFLGDSFTFGEGVRFEDTYAEAAARLLRKEHAEPGRTYESFNLGVGGYNTRQELWVLRNWGGLALKPDLVVVGYVLNDAEPPLFAFDPMMGGPVRQGRAIEEGLGDDEPSGDLFNSLRIARLAWKVLEDKKVSSRTESYYKSLYEPSNSGWTESAAALREIVAACRDVDVPCCVLVFPVLHRLGPDYPFREIHRTVVETATDAGAEVIDLLPAFEGQDAAGLWVHPADHHPNELAHAIAARSLVGELKRRGSLKSRLESPEGERSENGIGDSSTRSH